MNVRFVVMSAVLASGCEQIKSLKNIHELEGKVEALTKQVAELEAKKPGAGSAEGKKPEAAAAKAEENPEGKADAKAEAKADAKPEAKADATAEAKPDAKADPKTDAKADAKPEAKVDAKVDAKADAKPDAKPDETPAAVAAAGPADASGKPATADAPPAAGTGITGDPAFAKLLSVVAENTAKTHPNTGGGPRWAYGKPGSAAWAELDPAWKACGEGKAQSPIDIEPKASTASPIVFHYQPSAASVVDTGRTLQVNVAPGNTIELAGATYRLTQLQLHAPSEHTIAGEHYPLEVQLVHQDAAGKLAVISVMYDTGAASKALAGVWSAWPRKPGLDHKLAGPFDPSAVLPETRSVFRYTGSLTTPPCTEGVVWNVMRRTVTDSNAHLEAFEARYAHNTRELQALNERKIE
ncbi:MAG TPA: carbonic anhydrase family protein [Kofleriaceae bacterium]